MVKIGPTVVMAQSPVEEFVRGSFNESKSAPPMATERQIAD